MEVVVLSDGSLGAGLGVEEVGVDALLEGGEAKLFFPLEQSLGYLAVEPSVRDSAVAL